MPVLSALTRSLDEGVCFDYRQNNRDEDEYARKDEDREP